MGEAFGAIGVTLSLFGGTALIIWASTRARVARIRAEAEAKRMTGTTAPSDSVVKELETLQRRIAEMQNTGHQFDLSFDAALERLEGRLSRVETKVAVTPTVTPQAEEVQHVGLR